VDQDFFHFRRRRPEQRVSGTDQPGTDVMILKIFSPKNSAKKLALLPKLKLNYAKF
jgi:hypothetical protein